MTPRARSARQGDLFGAPLPAQADPGDSPGGALAGEVLQEPRPGLPIQPPQRRQPPQPSAPDALPFARQQLLDWQERLAAFQASLWGGADPQGGPTEAAEAEGHLPGGREAEQPSLFAGAAGPGGPAAATDPAALARSLRPLDLPAQNLAFWRWPQAPHQGPALYFVLDRPDHLRQPLLLYVGETARADRRWKGAHDCKSYLAAYQEALARADLEARLTIRFCCDAPPATGPRRALEQALIQRWKPPFNKETRGRWSTPFTADLD